VVDYAKNFWNSSLAQPLAEEFFHSKNDDLLAAINDICLGPLLQDIAVPSCPASNFPGMYDVAGIVLHFGIWHRYYTKRDMVASLIRLSPSYIRGELPDDNMWNGLYDQLLLMTSKWIEYTNRKK
jgi:hypothetical protein